MNKSREIWLMACGAFLITPVWVFVLFYVLVSSMDKEDASEDAESAMFSELLDCTKTVDELKEKINGR